VVRQVAIAGYGRGSVIYTRLNESNVEQTIQEQVAYFAGLGQDFEWKVFEHDWPPDLKDRLAVHGFEVGEPEAIMVLDLAEAPPVLFEPPAHTLRRIADPQGVDQVMAVEDVVWGERDQMVETILRRSLTDQPDRLSIYVAYVDEDPASAGWVYFPPHSQFASLWGGSTFSEYRGRGLYTALLAVRAREARQRGVKYLTVDASSMSRPILEKFGFERITTAYACEWKARVSSTQQ
jgi:GNAT superfamily N-acetyltransferase